MADIRHAHAHAERLMVLSLLLLAACCGAPPRAEADSLEERLSATTDYIPAAATPVEQLVDVAQKFKLPMAVEWVERSVAAAPDQALPARRRSVRGLIEAITASSPEHVVAVEGGLVRVYSPAAAAHPHNFLNIRLKSYDVHDGDLFAAQDQLRRAIRFTLMPQKYRDGYGGGYGHAANDVFEFPKFTLSAADVTIREVLNRIAEAQESS